MSQVTARLPDVVLESLDAPAAKLNRSRAEIIGQGIEHYLDDFDDISIALDRLRDPTDPVLEWDQVKRELVDPD